MTIDIIVTNMNKRKVNKSAPTPAYYQLKELVREQIQKKKLNPGDKLPSETKLSRFHEISKMTVRQGIMGLCDEGLLYRIRGKGTFVTKPVVERDLSELTSHTEALIASGCNVTTKVVKLGAMEVADPEVAETLEISKKDKIIKLCRLRLIDDEPFIVETSFLPHKLCPGLIRDDLSKNSLYLLLKNKYGLTLNNAIVSIEAIASENDLCALLEVRNGAPLVRLKQTTYLLDGRPIQYVEVISNSDKFKYLLTRKKKR